MIVHLLQALVLILVGLYYASKIDKEEFSKSQSEIMDLSRQAIFNKEYLEFFGLCSIVYFCWVLQYFVFVIFFSGLFLGSVGWLGYSILGFVFIVFSIVKVFTRNIFASKFPTEELKEVIFYEGF